MVFIFIDEYVVSKAETIISESTSHASETIRTLYTNNASSVLLAKLLRLWRPFLWWHRIDRLSRRPAGSARSSNATMESRKGRARKGGRNNGSERDILHRTKGSNVKTKKTKMTPSALLAQAEESLREGRPDEALAPAKRALDGLQPHDQTWTPACLPALNLMAEIHLELGEGDLAREYFLKAVDIDPDGFIPESQGGGAEKFLWLAQLSEEGGQDSVNWFKKGAEVLKREILVGMKEDEKDQDDAVKATMKKLASALCGIVELYMTDLSYALSFTRPWLFILEKAVFH